MALVTVEDDRDDDKEDVVDVVAVDGIGASETDEEIEAAVTLEAAAAAAATMANGGPWSGREAVMRGGLFINEYEEDATLETEGIAGTEVGVVGAIRLADWFIWLLFEVAWP